MECRVSSSNPAGSVDVEFFIDGNTYTYTKLQVKQTPGSYNGRLKTFVFTFTTNRYQNGKVAMCSLRWNGKIIEIEATAYLNITCKQLFLDWK